MIIIFSPYQFSQQLQLLSVQAVILFRLLNLTHLEGKIGCYRPHLQLLWEVKTNWMATVSIDRIQNIYSYQNRAVYLAHWYQFNYNCIISNMLYIWKSFAWSIRGNFAWICMQIIIWFARARYSNERQRDRMWANLLTLPFDTTFSDAHMKLAYYMIARTFNISTPDSVIWYIQSQALQRMNSMNFIVCKIHIEYILPNTDHR